MPILCALALAAVQDVPSTMTAAEARPALRKALDYLVATQEDDGSWGTSVIDDIFDAGYSVESYYCWQVSSNALAVMALLAADETPARRAALEKGLRFLCTTREPKRGSDWDADFLWSALYGTVACLQAARDPRFASAEWHELVESGGRTYLGILERNQIPTGGWAYYDDPIYSRRPKWGTSFCTALVLPSIRDALELGWIEDEAVLDRAHAYVARCALPNGAYEYDLNPIPRISGGEHINDVKGSLGRIQVCNWGRRSIGDEKITDDRLREGLESFFTDHRFLDVARMRPIPHEAYYANAGYFYMFGHYYAAQAIELLPPDEREAWHARLRPHLVKTQRADGSTSDFLKSRYMITAGTAYLALALQLGMRDEP